MTTVYKSVDMIIERINIITVGELVDCGYVLVASLADGEILLIVCRQTASFECKIATSENLYRTIIVDAAIKLAIVEHIVVGKGRVEISENTLDVYPLRHPTWICNIYHQLCNAELMHPDLNE